MYMDALFSFLYFPSFIISPCTYQHSSYIRRLLITLAFVRYKMSDTDSQESSSEWRTKSQKEKKRIHRKGYMHALTREQYDTILQLATGSFKVPVKERTREHNNARIRFYRNKKDFSARDRKLFYRGKEVIVKGNASNIVKKQFDLNCGSGSRSMSQQLKEKYANLSEATIKGCLSKSKDYQKAFAKFSNHSPPVPVTAKAVNER